MATRLCRNYQITNAILDMIHSARSRIILISPYVQLWAHLERELKAARDRKVIIALYFRKDQREKYAETLEKLAGIGVEVFEVDMLHAKVYASEETVVFASMNLYEFSTRNSEEVAIVTDEADLKAQFDSYIAEFNTSRTAVNITPSLKRGKIFKGAGRIAEAAFGAVAEAVLGPAAGYCIRCGEELEFNPDKPLCDRCFPLWNKYKDKTYKEKYCHDCGEKSATSMARPVCLRCFKAANAK